MKKLEKRKSIIQKLSQIAFITSLIFIIFPSKINAASGTVDIECDANTLKNGQTAKCYIKCKNFDIQIPSFHTKLTLSNSISLTKITRDSIWEGACDGGIIALYTDVNKTGNFNIASFEFQVPSSVNKITITLDEIRASDASFNKINYPKVEKTFNIGSGGGSVEPTTEKPADEEPTTEKQIDDEPTTEKQIDEETTTKKTTTVKPAENTDNNPQTGFNHKSILIVLIVTIVASVLLVKKGTGNQNE